MNRQPVTVAVTETESASALPKVLGALLLLGITVIHYLDLPSKMAETPYLGYMYIALMIGLVFAAGLLFYRPRTGWALGGALALLAFIGYSVNRTVGLPYAMGDIGNWAEPIGVASLLAEGLMVVLSAVMLGRRAGAV